MDKRDWTEELRERMDSYSEAAPEGLWDAISRKRAARKRAAAWWYSAGGLLAAAAVAALVLLLRPVSPDPSLPAEQARLAESVTEVPEVPAIAATESSSVSETGDSAHQPLSETPAVSETGDSAHQPLSETPAVSETGDSAHQPLPETPAVSETGDSAHRTSFPAATGEPAAPAATVPLRKTRGTRPASVQIRVSSGSCLAQAAGSTTTGYGFPDTPGLKAAPATKATGSSGSGLAQMLSRNKASTTASQHTQSARLAFLLHYDTGTRWGVETGLTGTTLRSTFDTQAGIKSSCTTRTLQYMGIPLFATFRALEWKKLSGYLSAGPMYEFCTNSYEYTSDYISGSSVSSDSKSLNCADHKWSLNIGAGMELGFGKNSAVFIQPGFSWHIPDDSALESFYTEHPASFSLSFGYRLRLF